MTSAIATVRNTLDQLRGRACFKFAGLLAEMRFPHSAETLLSGFLGDAPPSRQAYADLFCYFMTGFKVHRSRLGAHANFVGMGSYNGPAMDRLEGFSRIAPLAAAWLHGGRPPRVQLGDGDQAIGEVGELDLAACAETVCVVEDVSGCAVVNYHVVGILCAKGEVLEQIQGQYAWCC